MFRSRPEELRPPLEPTEWACYELQFEGDEVRAYVNGRRVVTVPREGGTGGVVSLAAQRVCVLFRRIEVVKR